jgi:hypothetical protein
MLYRHEVRKETNQQGPPRSWKSKIKTAYFLSDCTSAGVSPSWKNVKPSRIPMTMA